MAIDSEVTNAALLADFGQRLASRRIDLGLTQEELATRAEVGKRTVERVEAGRSVQLSKLLNLLRELDLLDALDALLPPAGPRPMDLLRRHGHSRKRVASKRRAPSQTSSSGKREDTASTWTWKDDGDLK